jgi:2-methylcitrate dehydratase PrpD
MAKLSAYMADAGTEKLPKKVVRDAKHHILDTIAAVVSGENARGTPENPMTGEEVVTKARGLITPVLGAAASAKLIDRLLDIDTVKNVRELRLLLQR